MPISIHPYFRNKQAACEAAGLIVALNSDGYNDLNQAQQQGQAYENIPVDLTFYFNGTVFTADE